MKSITAQNFDYSAAAPIAFFCAEYAINADESMYAGGLGVLAGDFMFEAGDQKMPLVAFGLKYTKTKTVENGFDLLTGADGAHLVIEVLIGEKVDGQKKIFLQVWVKSFSDKTFLLLLDSDFDRNAPEDRVLGDLYDQNISTRLKQEIYLGVGGVRLLKALSIEPRKYHLNEGSVAFAALAVLAEGFPKIHQSFDELLKLTRAKVVSTKHTILSVGTKIISAELWKMIGAYCEAYGISKELLFSLGAYKGDQDLFATTRFLINLSGKSNGVSAIHVAFEKQKYPTESHLLAVTNGVYIPRWQDARWRGEGHAADLPSQKIWGIKNALRKELVEDILKATGVELRPDVCTLVWSRRFVDYKRPLILFTDMLRLKSILLDTAKPLQIIISGKIAGTDAESVHMMERVRDAALDPMFKNKIVFIPNDSLAMEEKFVTGGDIWLNTPMRGVEACGTSGMKAGLNGALMMSVSDGWMDEVKWDNIGWILPNENNELAASLYEMLEKQILPEFYSRNSEGVPESWTDRMRATMSIVAKDFSATKMLEGYEKKMYGQD